MRIVPDTNAIAYLLLETEPHCHALRDVFARDVDLLAPASWEIEFANVLWLAARAHVVPPAQIAWKLRLANGLQVVSVPVPDLWEEATALSLAEGHPVYDTVFVHLARLLGAALLTYDQAVHRKFPDVARRAEDLLG